MPWDIGRLTPGELVAIVQARMEQGARERVELAWATAALSRQKKLPRLEKLLKPETRKRTLRDPEEARREFEELKERLGG
ncbi:hypothetical protein [Symbiobacterium terraclitae]|uniref:hypothetical protein n=1 Tax=Symbiobacterium terraclitae TaxID=557451 RepID=UPI0035B52B00